MKPSITKGPLISIIVASYNYENLITETLDSLLAQTYKLYEIIIVDDGSKDNSIEVINKYIKFFDNIYLYTHKNNTNKGLPESIKLGISKAKGEYIAFCESDDYWHPEYLERKVNVINKFKDVKIISNDVEMFGDKNTIDTYTEYFDTLKNELKLGWNDVDLSKSINYVPTFSAVMIKKDELIKLNYDSPIPAWLDMWLYKQIFKNAPLYYLPEKLTYWRMHKSSFNNNSNVKKYSLYGPLFHAAINNLLDDNKKVSNDINLQIQLLKKTDLFDSKFYKERYMDSIYGITPEAHYLFYGWKEGKDPSLSFSTNAYLANNNINAKLLETAPLIHYELIGKKYHVPIPSIDSVYEEIIDQTDIDFITNKPSTSKSVLIIHDNLENTSATTSLIKFSSFLIKEKHIPVILTLNDGELKNEIKTNNIKLIEDPAFAYHILHPEDLFLTFLLSFDIVIFNTLTTNHIIKIFPVSNSTKILWLHDGDYNYNYFKKTTNISSRFQLFDKVYATGTYSLSFSKKYAKVTDLTNQTSGNYQEIINTPKIINEKAFKKYLNKDNHAEDKLIKSIEFRKIKDLTLKDYHQIKNLIKSNDTRLDLLFKLVLKLCKSNLSIKPYKLMYKILWYKALTKEKKLVNLLRKK